MTPDPLDQPASVRTLRQWHREGRIDAAVLAQGVAMLRPAASWQAWLRMELLLAGMALVLSGIVFFAYNWQDMGRFEKLGLLQAALLGCMAGAWWTGLRTLPGQVLVLTATVLTGVFLAVFGQIYQTGADAYELFMGWAALTVVWVVCARFEALWFLWLVIVQAGIFTFWDQVARPAWEWDKIAVMSVLGALNAAALVVHERVKAKSPTGRGWLRVVLVLSLLGALTMPALEVIFEGLEGQPYRLAYVPVWLAAAAGCYRYFRFVQPDFACVALTAADAMVVVLCVIGRILINDSGWFSSDESGQFMLMSLVVIAATAGLSVWLAREHRALKHLPP